MNKIIIVGNITADPQLRTTQSGVSVCSFTVAVNRRQTANAGQPEADFFRVTAWRGLGENCAKWLIKGKKVGVTGSISASAYMGNDGKPHASMDIRADDVEFLSPANTAPSEQKPAQAQDFRGQQNFQQPSGGGFTQVEEEDLPFE